jgi:sugar phosphate isomerase/epimerase
MILNEPAKVAERVRKFGGKATACPSPGPTKLDSLEDVLHFAKLLNQAGRIMRENGVALAYHNHHREFRCFGRRTMLEILYQESDPANVKGQPDTYWVQYGGGDPVEWCERLKGRLASLHMKDYMITEKNEPTYCEIGRGNLSWKRIIAAAEAGGCPWFIVEQDHCEGDPFDSLRMSFEYIRDNLCA